MLQLPPRSRPHDWITLYGAPIPSENFIFAAIDAGNLTPRQALPNAPDPDWDPAEMPHAPGPNRRGRNAAE